MQSGAIVLANYGVMATLSQKLKPCQGLNCDRVVTLLSNDSIVDFDVNCLK